MYKFTFVFYKKIALAKSLPIFLVRTVYRVVSAAEKQRIQVKKYSTVKRQFFSLF